MQLLEMLIGEFRAASVPASALADLQKLCVT
jgi:hypothetical protein